MFDAPRIIAYEEIPIEEADEIESLKETRLWFSLAPHWVSGLYADAECS